uniref:Uncharacterized protein n=1 Tax=Arundo donax TaxID=35708 RepID=A0A0A9ACQ1_ARUDO
MLLQNYFYPLFPCVSKIWQSLSPKTHHWPSAADSTRKGVHAGRPQVGTHNEIHGRRPDDILIDELSFGTSTLSRRTRVR